MPTSSQSLAAWSPTSVQGEVTALDGHGLRAAAAVRSGEVLVSLDGGRGWESTAPLPGGPSVTTVLLLPRAILAGTAGRGLWRSDGIGEWGPATKGLGPGRTVLSLAQKGRVTLAGTLRAGVFRSTDGGHTWSAANNGLPLIGDGLEVSQLVAIRRAWYALHPFGVSESLDGGLHWRLVGAGLPSNRRPSMLAEAGGGLYAEVGTTLYQLTPAGRWLADGAVGPIRLVGWAGDTLVAMLPDGRMLGYSRDAGRSWGSLQQGLPIGGLVTTVGATQESVLAALDGDGLWIRPLPTESAAGADGVRRVPAEAALQANDPNPFSDRTTIPFTLSTETDVVLTVHDIENAEVVRLAEGAYPAGEHRVLFEASALPVGLYHCRLYAGGRSYDRSMVLLR